MKEQLLDGLMIIASVEDDDEALYAGTTVYRFDLESVHLEEFIKKFVEPPGVVHVAKDKAYEVIA